MRALSYAVVAACLTLLGALPSAQAQQQQEELTEGNVAFLVLCATSSPFFMSFSFASYAIDAREEDLKEEIKHYEKIVRLRRYLHNNERAVWATLSLGAGESMHDFARLYGQTKPTPAQSKALRQRRARLIEIIKQPDTFTRSRTLYIELAQVFSPSLTSTSLKHIPSKELTP